jgi:hypothetical protein
MDGVLQWDGNHTLVCIYGNIVYEEFGVGGWLDSM